MPGRIVLISNDLMVVSRVQGAAQQRGADVRAVANLPAAIELHRDEPVGLVIVDLATISLDLAAIVAAFNANPESPARLIAFGPHVHEEKLAAAREAGFDQVVSRGKFFSEIDGIIESN
jgi:DNA-binding response OmpR family regulator